jgi:hypothetical protein
MVETILEGGSPGRKFVIQREVTEDGKTRCFRVGYRGNGYYFTTEAEAYAYCEGRGFPVNNPFTIDRPRWAEWWSFNNPGEPLPYTND